mmetsp:Transcript_21164/g.47488  ORF Transcript_21164/g.47488 Transcript_21164/m.47488 type:complete len:241 (-) Transcript_21164:618-1340(-)
MRRDGQNYHPPRPAGDRGLGERGLHFLADQRLKLVERAEEVLDLLLHHHAIRFHGALQVGDGERAQLPLQNLGGANVLDELVVDKPAHATVAARQDAGRPHHHHRDLSDRVRCVLVAQQGEPAREEEHGAHVQDANGGERVEQPHGGERGDFGHGDEMQLVDRLERGERRDLVHAPEPGAVVFVPQDEKVVGPRDVCSQLVDRCLHQRAVVLAHATTVQVNVAGVNDDAVCRKTECNGYD